MRFSDTSLRLRQPLLWGAPDVAEVLERQVRDWGTSDGTGQALDVDLDGLDPSDMTLLVDAITAAVNVIVAGST